MKEGFRCNSGLTATARVENDAVDFEECVDMCAEQGEVCTWLEYLPQTKRCVLWGEQYDADATWCQHETDGI
jgi:hypothetical protein